MSEILRMEKIHKRFPGVHALKGVDFRLERGDIHALLGENGAGKSTMIKILAGIYTMDDGSITIEHNKCTIKSVHDSQKYGISVIHQELCLVPNMNVAENIFLGKEPSHDKSFFIDNKKLYSDAQKLINSLGLDIQATEKVSTLSVAQQQMVEITKALSINAKILVMDEPTSSLTQNEVEILFRTIRKLKINNVSIIYVSHKLEEIFEISDKITVLRDGNYISTKETRQTNRNELITMMVGRELTQFYLKADRKQNDEIIFEVKNIYRKGDLNNISFSLRKGEILGLAGLVGAGRTELARAIFGIDSIDSGEIYIRNIKCKIKTPRDAMKNGIAYVPEDRKQQGLFLYSSVGYNITMLVLNQFIKIVGINKNKENTIVKNYVDKLSIKTPHNKQLVNNLSGGNQQKVVLAKWLASEPKVLILDEPTRGIDVGAKAEIYSIMSMLAKNGVSIIMISSELTEIINMCDRVLVMSNGRLTGNLSGNDVNQEQIMQCVLKEMCNELE